MTVADNTSRNQYTATSGQTVFAYTFEIVDKGDIVVLQNGTTLSEGTNYTVSGVGAQNGGNITLTVGATTGDVMTLYRDMAYSRTQNYADSGDFLASEVNSDFDNLWLAGEQTNRAFSQSIRKPITDSDSISMELPVASTRANKFLAFDSVGGITLTPAGDGVNPSTIQQEDFTGDGTTTVFTLSIESSEFSVLIYIDGVYQERGTYSVAGRKMPFTEAPPQNASIEVLLFKVADIPSTSTITRDEFTGDGTTTSFALTASTTYSNITSVVYVDGIYQEEATYSISGTTITFTEAPPINAGVEVLNFKVTDITNPATISREDFVADGTTTEFTITGSGPFNKISSIVYVDGLCQEESGYLISGSTLTFTEAPPANALVEVLRFKVVELDNLNPEFDSVTADVVSYTPSLQPASASAGDVYYDITTNKLRCYNGTAWIDLF